MTDLEGLQADPFWQDALVLGKQLMHLGHGDGLTHPQRESRVLLDMATRIPRLVGEAHLASSATRRTMFFSDVHAALEEVQRLLAGESRRGGADQDAVEDAFVCADALREKIELARQRGEFICLSA